MKSIFVTFLTLITLISNSQDVVQWRGENRMGNYNETGLLEEWPASGPEVAWHYDELGKGYSSVVVQSGSIYVTGMEETEGYVYCLNLDGALKWKSKYGEEWSTNFPGTRTTPTIDNGKLYFMSSQAKAICMSAEDGNIIWQRDIAEEYDAQQLRWGMTESPLIVDDKVIITVGGSKATMLALNKESGDIVWINKSLSDKTAYCSPLLINHNGNKIIATSLEKHIVGFSANDGKLLWKYPQNNRYSIHPNTPLYDGENVYSISGYGTGCTMLKLSEDGSSISLGWKTESLDNQMGGVILIDGKIYGSGHQNNKAWQCLDAITGKVLYETKVVGAGAIVYNDGLLYTYSQDAKVSILKPTGTSFELKGSVKVEIGSEQHWAHPVISGGILYVRHGNVLMAYNIKK